MRQPGVASPCVEWNRSCDSDGYGRRWHDGRLRKAHRVAWELANGPVPEGLEIDHLCRNRACVNPAHMEPVTHRENVLRGDSPSARGARQTHCVNGHPFDEPNTRVTARQRVCRSCERLSSARQKQANPERFLALARARTAAWKWRRSQA